QRQHVQADKVYSARMDGKQGAWAGFDGIVTAIDRGQWEQARRANQAELEKAIAGRNLIEELAARAGELELAALSTDPDMGVKLQQEIRWHRANADAIRAIYPPSADEYSLVIGIAAAIVGNAE